jgi:hypothetical protein
MNIEHRLKLFMVLTAIANANMQQSLGDEDGYVIATAMPMLVPRFKTLTYSSTL